MSEHNKHFGDKRKDKHEPYNFLRLPLIPPETVPSDPTDAGGHQAAGGTAIHPDFGKKIREAASSAHEQPASAMVHVRWMIQKDMPRVVQIDTRSFGASWSEQEWRSTLKQHNVIGMVMEIGEQVVGAFIYELNKDHIMLSKLAVDPDFRRRGVGFAAVDKLLTKLDSDKKFTEILAIVPEDNLVAQQFLRACGFWACIPDSDNRSIPGENHYLFRAHRECIKELRMSTARKGAGSRFKPFLKDPE